MNLPSVTILIANYNDENYIDRCIESAVNQDFSGPLTVCIVDDGSEDESWDIITSYLKNPKEDKIEEGIVLTSKNIGRFERTSIIAIKSKNGGPSSARNIGINYTLEDTDVYAILDSDDEMYENKISSCTDLVQECIVHSGALILKDALQDVLEDTGYYDETMRTCEDYDLWMRISEKYIIAHVPKSLTKVRVTGDNSSFIVNQEVWQKNWMRVMEKMQQRTNG
jgi:glycosyltransferase involved in cell wall biosynthesis